MSEQRIQEYLKQHAKLCQTRIASAEEKTLDKIVGTLWKLMTKEEKREAERRLKRKDKELPTLGELRGTFQGALEGKTATKFVRDIRDAQD